MNVFLDSGSVAEIEWAVATGLIDGVTTNAILLTGGANGTDHHARVAEIAHMVTGPVCVEVVAVDADAMCREGKELARLADNIVVQIPMIEEGIVAVRRLSADGVRVDTTLIFNAAQALFAAKAGAAFVSPCVGRLDDIGENGVTLLRDIRTIFDRYGYECDVLASAVRTPAHFIAAARAGADGATLTSSVLKALLLHPLTDLGLDQFLNDWSRRIARTKAD